MMPGPYPGASSFGPFAPAAAGQLAYPGTAGRNSPFQQPLQQQQQQQLPVGWAPASVAAFPPMASPPTMQGHHPSAADQNWATFNAGGGSIGPSSLSPVDPFGGDPFLVGGGGGTGGGGSIALRPSPAFGETTKASSARGSPALDPFADLGVIQADTTRKKMDKSAFVHEEPKPSLMVLSRQRNSPVPMAAGGTSAAGNPFAPSGVSHDNFDLLNGSVGGESGPSTAATLIPGLAGQWRAVQRLPADGQ